jgi:hypothetical protein
MAFRTFALFLCICVATIACNKEESLNNDPLGVTSMVDHKYNITQTFRYHDKKLSTYFSKRSSDTLAMMMFHFSGEQLSYITMDSVDTADHVIERSFVYNLGNELVDSTFHLEPDTTYLTAVRSVTYDTDKHPLVVNLKTWTANAETGELVTANELAELTWQNGNVSNLYVYDVSANGGKFEKFRLQITKYDDQHCIYMPRPEYLYTLALKDLFWLSKNNPLVFFDYSGKIEHGYDYNKFGYPSSYLDEGGATIGMTYTQIR